MKQVNGWRRSAIDVATEKGIKSAIQQHGKKVVERELGRLMRVRSGPKGIDDWPELRVFLERDVEEWLSGNNPFDTRKNYSIAKEFADSAPGHSHPSTMKRIERKLKAKNARRYYVFCRAFLEAREAHPHARYFDALHELALIQPNGPWPSFIEVGREVLEEYSAKVGEVPTDLPISDIERAVAKARGPIQAGLLHSASLGVLR